MQCPSCAQEVPVGARFCPNCGHLLVRTEERRIVTVLFADLVGFTGLSEELDPEQLKHLIERCFQRLVADITAFGGTVDKIIGDAVVALFGAPKAHEDDPERAVRAALRMQRSLAAIATELSHDLQMRIGVNTGEVLVGALQAAGDYTAMGDTVNVASRLQTIASPGEVLVGPVTREATVQAVAYESRGSIALRGRDEPVEVAVAMVELAPPGRRTQRDRVPMVGRDVEHAQLGSGVATSVVRGRAHLINILGEAGMGKTRLAEEVAIAAEAEHDAFVLEGRALPYGEMNPLRPMGEAFGGACDLGDSDSPDIAFGKVSELVQGVLGLDADEAEVEKVTEAILFTSGRPTPLASLEVNRRTAELRDALRRFFVAACTKRPMVLLLGDVHWADQRLLDLVEYLLDALASYPFVVVVTARWTVDEDRWVVPPGRHHTMVLNLGALDREAAGQLIRALVDEDIADALVDQLFDRSGGNPFFLEEIASLLREAGVLGPGARLDIGAQGVAELPDTLRGLVAARIDSLTDDERAMVDNAAVIGRRGSVYGLLLMSERADDEGGRTTFRRLVDKDIFATSNEYWTFRSDLVGEVAYSMLTKTARAMAHVRVADWIVRHGAASEDEALIANHFAAAAELLPDVGSVEGLPEDLVGTAVDWLERAGLQADGRDSHYAAAQLFHRALGLLSGDDVRRITPSLGRSRARLGLRELTGAIDDAEEARRLAALAEPVDQSSIAHALRTLGEIHSALGERERAADHLAEALLRFQAIGDPAEIAETLRLRGMVALFEGDHASADADFLEAHRVFTELDDKAGVGWCLQNLAWLSFELGLLDEARERLTTAIDLFTEVDDKGGLGFAKGLMAFVLFHEGHSHDAESIAVEVHDTAKVRGARFSEAMMDLLLASIQLWSGRARTAVARAVEAKAVFEAIESEFGLVQTLGLLGRAYAAIGEVDKSRVALSECLELALAAPGQPQVTFARLVSAGGAIQSGRPGDALEQLARVGEIDTSRRIIGSTDLEVTSALAALQLGRVDEAIERLDDAPIDPNGPNTYRDSSLALASAAAGDIAVALECADRVLDDGRATYLDRRTAYLARCLTHARTGDLAAMESGFVEALAMADATESAMSKGLVRLARAVAYEELDDHGAAAYRLEAEAALAGLGGWPRGWERAFRLAAGDSPATQRVSG